MTGEAYFAGLSLGAIVYCAAAVFIAALVRGYSGFGLSALIVTSLALVIPPAEVVPLAMLLEVLASTNWNKAEAARRLRWSRMTLYRRLRTYRIEPPD